MGGFAPQLNIYSERIDKMSAKGILKKIREIYVKLAARKLVGNFRYRKFWSDKASAFMRDRELFSFVENTDDSLGSAFVRDVREYYNYYGEYDLQAINLALSLLRDIYSPEVLPVELCEEVFGRKRTAELIGEELFELLCKFGGMDIVYHDDKHKVPKWIKNCCHLNRKLYLTNNRVGMPVRMFLIWAKGGVTLPPDIMEEWSGIPRYGVRETYNAIIGEFRDVIIRKHNWDRTIKRIPKISTVIY